MCACGRAQAHASGEAVSPACLLALIVGSEWSFERAILLLSELSVLLFAISCVQACIQRLGILAQL